MYDWLNWQSDSTRPNWRGLFQARRGDIGPILLGVLSERPMHGYEVIRHLEEKTHGLWRPSPGSVYPTLQLLEEQELVRSHEQAGKKVYELTEQGRTAASHSAKWPHGWDAEQLGHLSQMRDAILGVVGPFKQIARLNTPATFEQALQIMTTTHEQLTMLLEASKGTKGNAVHGK